MQFKCQVRITPPDIYGFLDRQRELISTQATRARQSVGRGRVINSVKHDVQVRPAKSDCVCCGRSGVHLSVAYPQPEMVQ